jgi:hypothetical protein
MEHTKHVFRVLLLLAAFIVTYILVRGFFVPKSFGRYGHYRYDNVLEQRHQPLVHGTVDGCRGCHEQIWAKRAKGKHAVVPCEDCHAPLSTHAAAGKRIAAMVKDPSYKLCVRCHRKLPNRPAAVIRQVVPEEHVTSQGETLQGNVCVGCHDVHSPQMGDDSGDAAKAAPAPAAKAAPAPAAKAAPTDRKQAPKQPEKAAEPPQGAASKGGAK